GRNADSRAVGGSDERRGRDLNPRYEFCPYTRLAGERLRPLGHLSVLPSWDCAILPFPPLTRNDCPPSGGAAVHQSQLKRFHSALGFRFPLPQAGEGQGEGVSGRSSHQRGSLPLALSQRERERRPKHWRKALSCDHWGLGCACARPCCPKQQAIGN